MKLLFVKFPFGTEMRMSQQNHEGGWSGIGMATVGIHPNDFDLYPNKIPPGRVVQNCPLGNQGHETARRVTIWPPTRKLKVSRVPSGYGGVVIPLSQDRPSQRNGGFIGVA